MWHGAGNSARDPSLRGCPNPSMSKEKKEKKELLPLLSEDTQKVR